MSKTDQKRSALRHSPSGRRPSAAILDETYRRRLRTIDLTRDSEWLRELTSRPSDTLGAMSRRGQLHRVGEGRFVVAPPGTSLLEQAAPASLLVDLTLGQLGRYYIGFLSALISHHLTDLHSDVYYAAVPQGTRLRGKRPMKLKLVQLAERLWPIEEELERFRVLESTKEFAYRSTLERTLVDGLLRPDLSGSFETVALSWARARGRSDVSWRKVARIAKRLGDAPARRTALMLNELGLTEVAEQEFADLKGRSTSTPLDRSDAFGLPKGAIERDSQTGVLLNVPRRNLRGWLAGEIG